jgi:hypothetical protein
MGGRGRVRRGDGVGEALRNVLPARFNWPLFGIALLLMAAPVFQAYQQISNRTKANQSEL